MLGKEQILLLTVSSFPVRFFKDLFHQGDFTDRILWKSDIPKQAMAFTCLRYKSFENTVGKGEIAHIDQFLFSPRVFYQFRELSAILTKFEIVVGQFFWIGRV